jgi:hypothetical protein
MLTIKIDAFHIQPSQRSFAGSSNIVGLTADAAHLGICWIALDAEFRCDKHRAAPSGNRLADEVIPFETVRVRHCVVPVADFEANSVIVARLPSWRRTGPWNPLKETSTAPPPPSITAERDLKASPRFEWALQRTGIETLSNPE